VEIKFILEQPRNALRGRRYVALLFNPGARWWWIVNTTPWPLYPQKIPGTHSTGGWLGPGANLDGCGKSRPSRNSISVDGVGVYGGG